MKAAFIASILVIVGMILFIGILLFGNNNRLHSSKKNTSAAMVLEEDDLTDPEISFDKFEYLDSCRKYLLKDFLDIDIFENNKADLKTGLTKQTIQAGKKLESVLIALKEQKKEEKYILVLEGNLANEWAAEFDRNNTWAYRVSYDRAVAVYKLWLQNDVNIRKYNIETIITGSGYYGLCPIKNKSSKRFSVQLIPKS